MSMPRLLLCALISAGVMSGALAATAWDEAVTGDLANLGTTPTLVSLGLGSNPTGGSATGLLGWWHHNPNDIGTDILPSVGLGPGASGFAGPLQAGSYAFWIQETATGSAAYRFDFSASVVPEASTALLLMGGRAGLAALRLLRPR